MTVIAAPLDAWCSTFCPSCSRIVQFQAEDVQLTARATQGRVHAEGADTIIVHLILCPCGAPIEVARHL